MDKKMLFFGVIFAGFLIFYDFFTRVLILSPEINEPTKKNVVLPSFTYDEIDVDKYNMLVLKYDNLIWSCDFEHIPSNIKTEVSMLFQNNNKNVPIQLNGVMGGFKRNSRPIEMSSEIV